MLYTRGDCCLYGFKFIYFTNWRIWKVFVDEAGDLKKNKDALKDNAAEGCSVV